MHNKLSIQTELSLPAPAKLNLFLHITSQRADGYHNLQTIFQFLDHADELFFNARKDGIIKLHTYFIDVPHESNLITKAANLLKAQAKTSLGADIWINKKLPMGGGLGGGSSNAATTLLALNHLWKTHYNLSQLAELGLQLGADVPVFIHGKAAFAEGVGEQLTFINPPEHWYLVAIPKVNINTASVFKAPSLTRNTPLITPQEALSIDGHNDCQAVVLKNYPVVKYAFTLMNELYPTKMTGTGACLFSAFTTQEEALQAHKKLASHLNCFVAKSTNQSLLHCALKTKANTKHEPY